MDGQIIEITLVDIELSFFSTIHLLSDGNFLIMQDSCQRKMKCVIIALNGTLLEEMTLPFYDARIYGTWGNFCAIAVDSNDELYILNWKTKEVREIIKSRDIIFGNLYTCKQSCINESGVLYFMENDIWNAIDLESREHIHQFLSPDPQKYVLERLKNDERIILIKNTVTDTSVRFSSTNTDMENTWIIDRGNGYTPLLIGYNSTDIKLYIYELKL